MKRQRDPMEPTRWESFTANPSPANSRRRAHYWAEIQRLQALSAEDQAWLAEHGLAVGEAIDSCYASLISAMWFG